MAFTVSYVDKTNVGNLKMNIISCTVDTASGNIDTGLSVVHGHALGPISMATASPLLKKNVGSGATARNGILNINGVAAGDVFCLVVYGV